MFFYIVFLFFFCFIFAIIFIISIYVFLYIFLESFRSANAGLTESRENSSRGSTTIKKNSVNAWIQRNSGKQNKLSLMNNNSKAKPDADVNVSLGKRTIMQFEESGSESNDDNNKDAAPPPFNRRRVSKEKKKITVQSLRLFCIVYV